jgi:hypothetical protein
MRPIESLLVVANLLTFLMFAVPQIRVRRWTGYIVFITLTLAVVQVLVEGPRWQMVPAYMLTGLFLVAWMVQRVASASGRVLCRYPVSHGYGTLCRSSHRAPCLSFSWPQRTIPDWYSDLSLGGYQSP